MEHYDITIVGAGLTGLSLALALSSSKFKVLLIESKEKLEVKSPGKAFALSYGSCHFLSSLGIALTAKSPIEQVHISQKASFGSLRLSAEDAGVSALGYLINESDLMAELLTAVRAHPTLTIAYPVKLEAYDQNQLTLSDRTIHTTLLIGADGTHSTVKKLCQMPDEVIGTPEAALVCRLTVERPHQHIAYQRFTPTETFGLIPGAPHEYALIISGTPEIIDAWKALSDAAFLARFYQQFGHRIGAIKLNTTRLIFPLESRMTRQPIQPGVVLMGNAAHTLHPIAAQGWNLTLKDVEQLTERLNRTAPADLGKLNVLSDYQEQRTREQEQLMKATQLLTTWFKHTHPALRLLRTMGLSAVDILTPLRVYLTQRGAESIMKRNEGAKSCR